MDSFAAMFVGLRLMAVWLLVTTVQQAVWSLDWIVRMEDGSGTWQVMGAVLAALAVALLLWVSSGSIARRTARKVGDDRAGPTAPAVSVYYRLGILLLGIWMVAMGMPRVLSLGWTALQTSSSGDVAGSGFVPAVIVQSVYVVTGLVLVLGSSWLSRLFYRFQEFGLPRGHGRSSRGSSI